VDSLVTVSQTPLGNSGNAFPSYAIPVSLFVTLTAVSYLLYFSNRVGRVHLSRALSAVCLKLGERALGALFQTPLPLFLNHPVAQYEHTLNSDFHSLFQSLERHFASVIYSFFTFTLSILLILFRFPVLLCICVPCCGLIYMISGYFNRIQEEFKKKSALAQASASQWYEYLLQARATIAGLGHQKKASQIMARMIESAGQEESNLQSTTHARTFLLSLVGFAFILLCLIMSWYFAQTQKGTFGDAGALMGLSLIVLRTFLNFVEMGGGFALAMHTMERCAQLAQLPIQEAGRTPLMDVDRQWSRQIIAPGQDRISFPLISWNNVTLSYPGTRKQVVSQIQLDIFSGEIIGIMGRTGSGKTTLLQSLFGSLRPTKGSVQYKGVALSLLPFSEWKNRISYVSQEPLVLPGSVPDNLQIGLDTPLELPEMLGVLENLGWQESIHLNPESLSLGQKQLLGLARALLRKPEILVLDEFTCYLDPEKELQVLKFVRSLSPKLTILMVSHRRAPLQICHRIFHLPSGHTTLNAENKE
jgi:ABC-type multidrug transport system fused ATPase/permease subunit